MNEIIKYLNNMNENGWINYSDYSNLVDMAQELEAENAQLKARLQNAIELPCKVGDTVYWVEEWNNSPTIYEFEVLGITYKINKKGFELRVVLDKFLNPVVDYYKDKNLFFDRTKAEAKLRKLKGDNI